MLIIIIILNVKKNCLSTLNSFFFRCGVKYHDSSKLSAIIFTIITLTLLTIITCYTHILRTIHNIKEDLSAANSNSHRNSVHYTSDIERKTLNKVLTYILVFLFQYIPLM